VDDALELLISSRSDALGHVLNMIGRDWTHIGVAKLYTDIVANGYHILYLTSRSVGQADTTRGYLNGVIQDGYKLPRGPVIMSPDRTMAALRREVYLRKPEVFKMACLRDITNLFQTSSSVLDSSGNPSLESNTQHNPFYAGFGNRLTDALSYRSVAIPPTRIFTINSNAEVSLHLLTLNNFRTSYLSIWELVDQFFPPIGLLIKEGGEEYTDFNYWRDKPRELIDFSSESEEDGDDADEDEEYDGRPSIDDDINTDAEDLEASFMSRGSTDEPTQNSVDLEAIEEGGNEDYDPPDNIIVERRRSSDTVEDSFLVEESRQLEALNLAAEETQEDVSPSLKRAATTPLRGGLEETTLD
jgi:phosphatidate phosphatase LPIN